MVLNKLQPSGQSWPLLGTKNGKWQWDIKSMAQPFLPQLSKKILLYKEADLWELTCKTVGKGSTVLLAAASILQLGL